MFQAPPLRHRNSSEAERFSPKGGPNKLLLAQEVLDQRTPKKDSKAEGLSQTVRLGRGAKPVIGDLFFAFGQENICVVNLSTHTSTHSLDALSIGVELPAPIRYFLIVSDRNVLILRRLL